MASFDEVLQKSVEAFRRLPPEEKRRMRAAQRKSWMIGETMLEHPEMTRAEAEAIYDKVIRG